MITTNYLGRKFAVFPMQRRKRLFPLMVFGAGLLFFISSLIWPLGDPGEGGIGGAAIGIFYCAFGMIKMGYDLYQEKPCLSFSEDMFLLETLGYQYWIDHRVEGYWRDVTEIISDPTDSSVILVVKGSKKVLLDPKVIDFKCENVSAMAREFRNHALTKGS